MKTQKLTQTQIDLLAPFIAAKKKADIDLGIAYQLILGVQIAQCKIENGVIFYEEAPKLNEEVKESIIEG